MHHTRRAPSASSDTPEAPPSGPPDDRPNADRTPYAAIDPVTGRSITYVPLANHPVPARLLTDDYEHLCALGFTDCWTFNAIMDGYAYVRCAAHSATGRLVTIARLVTEAPSGTQVRYRDGDRTNLLPENLEVRSGRGGDRELALMRRAEARVEAGEPASTWRRKANFRVPLAASAPLG